MSTRRTLGLAVGKLDNVVSPGTPQQFAAILERVHASNARIVKEANIKAE